MNERTVITCVGEILWDALPDGLFLGGAPLNVCFHLNQLGEKAEMISRVGADRLGKEAMGRIQRAGLGTDFIQNDPQHETGFVKVELNAEGDPRYEIIKPSAWDFIDIQRNSVRELLHQSWAVVYGTLAHRMNESLFGLTDFNCFKVLDMNLRAPHFEKEGVLKLIEHSDLIKMNDEELDLLSQWCGLSGPEEKALQEIAETLGCRAVCVTRGGKGAALFYNNRYFEHPGYPVRVVDAVGAGDAFLASLLYGLKTRREEEDLLAFANAAGAYVASHSGANPVYSQDDLKKMMQH